MNRRACWRRTSLRTASGIEKQQVGQKTIGQISPPVFPLIGGFSERHSPGASCASVSRRSGSTHLSQPPPSPEVRLGGDYSDVAVRGRLCKFGSPAGRQRVPALSRCALKARRRQRSAAGYRSSGRTQIVSHRLDEQSFMTGGRGPHPWLSGLLIHAASNRNRWRQSSVQTQPPSSDISAPPKAKLDSNCPFSFIGFRERCE
jgi:hypothetical protein